MHQPRCLVQQCAQGREVTRSDRVSGPFEQHVAFPLRPGRAGGPGSGAVERCRAAEVPDRRRGAPGQQRRDRGRVAARGGEVQRRVAVGVGHVRVQAGGQQQRDRREPALADRPAEHEVIGVPVPGGQVGRRCQPPVQVGPVQPDAGRDDAVDVVESDCARAPLPQGGGGHLVPGAHGDGVRGAAVPVDRRQVDVAGEQRVQ